MATMTDTNIVKSLEKEFDMIDYSQWERTDRAGRSRSAQISSLPPIRWSPEALGNHWTIVKKDQEKTAARRVTQEQNKSEGIFRPRTEQFCSNKCNHPWHKRIVLREDEPCFVEMNEKITILKYLITAKKKQVVECKEYSKTLRNMNMKLSKEMTETDEAAMKKSRNLLVQYSKFRKGISGVGEWKRQEIEVAKIDLKDTEKVVGQKSKELHRRVEEINTRLRNAQKELHMLKEFRDKEFPVYSLRIAELQREIGKLPQKHQAELDNTEQIALAQRRKLESTLKEKEQEILQKIAELNKDMERNNLELQQQTLHLLKSKKDCREEIFADILTKQPKCTPDMDVVLDIPKEEWLPI